MTLTKKGNTERDWLSDHPDRLLKTKDAAEFLGFSDQCLRAMRCRNEGPRWLVMPNGHTIRYRFADVKRWAGVCRGNPDNHGAYEHFSDRLAEAARDMGVDAAPASTESNLQKATRALAEIGNAQKARDEADERLARAVNDLVDLGWAKDGDQDAEP